MYSFIGLDLTVGIFLLMCSPPVHPVCYIQHCTCHVLLPVCSIWVNISSSCMFMSIMSSVGMYTDTFLCEYVNVWSLCANISTLCMCRCVCVLTAQGLRAGWPPLRYLFAPALSTKAPQWAQTLEKQGHRLE